MGIKINDTFKLDGGKEFVVVKRGGSGGQGSIWFLKSRENPAEERVLKILSERNPDMLEKKKHNIRNLYAKRDVLLAQLQNSNYKFALPLQIYNNGSDFGYFMHKASGTDINRMMLDKKFDKASPKTRLNLVYKIAEAMTWLERNAFCYQDISHKNIMYDEKTDTVTTIDCDNIVPNTFSQSGEMRLVTGSGFFIAPEVAFGKTNPGLDSDNYALAFLFFIIMTSSTFSPYHGRALFSKPLKPSDMLTAAEYYNDDPSYGTDWLTFIFDKTKMTNRIDLSIFRDPEAKARQVLIAKNWEAIPLKMKELFYKAFEKPLDPAFYKHRPKPNDWKKAATELLADNPTQKQATPPRTGRTTPQRPAPQRPTPQPSPTAKSPSVTFPSGKTVPLGDTLDIMFSDITPGSKSCFGTLTRAGGFYSFTSKSIFKLICQSGGKKIEIMPGQTVPVLGECELYCATQSTKVVRVST